VYAGGEMKLMVGPGLSNAPLCIVTFTSKLSTFTVAKLGLDENAVVSIKVMLLGIFKVVRPLLKNAP
jgi:hypothetical protein